MAPSSSPRSGCAPPLRERRRRTTVSARKAARSESERSSCAQQYPPYPPPQPRIRGRAGPRRRRGAPVQQRVRHEVAKRAHQVLLVRCGRGCIAAAAAAQLLRRALGGGGQRRLGGALGAARRRGVRVRSRSHGQGYCATACPAGAHLRGWRSAARTATTTSPLRGMRRPLAAASALAALGARTGVVRCRRGSPGALFRS